MFSISQKIADSEKLELSIFHNKIWPSTKNINIFTFRFLLFVNVSDRKIVLTFGFEVVHY